MMTQYRFRYSLEADRLYKVGYIFFQLSLFMSVFIYFVDWMNEICQQDPMIPILKNLSTVFVCKDKSKDKKLHLTVSLGCAVVTCLRPWYLITVTSYLLGTRASQITSPRILYSAVYSGTDQRNFKSPRHWPLWGEFTGDRWIPYTKGQ